MISIIATHCLKQIRELNLGEVPVLTWRKTSFALLILETEPWIVVFIKMTNGPSNNHARVQTTEVETPRLLCRTGLIELRHLGS